MIEQNKSLIKITSLETESTLKIIIKVEYGNSISDKDIPLLLNNHFKPSNPFDTYTKVGKRMRTQFNNYFNQYNHLGEELRAFLQTKMCERFVSKKYDFKDFGKGISYSITYIEIREPIIAYLFAKGKTYYANRLSIAFSNLIKREKPLSEEERDELMNKKVKELLNLDLNNYFETIPNKNTISFINTKTERFELLFKELEKDFPMITKELRNWFDLYENTMMDYQIKIRELESKNLALRKIIEGE